jgi:ElaB/YqjD/DUF883 family membrane-anchored ribosome-binding protein
MSNTTASKEKLVADLKLVVADTEELLRATAGQAGEKVTELRGRLEKRLQDAKVSLADAQAFATEKAKAAAHAADDFVQTEPWKAVGIAAALGLALGVLIGRR